MAFTRPTLAEIADRVRQDFVSRLALTGAVLRRSMVYVLSMVIAGAAHMLHGHLDFLAAQLFADTAEGSFLVRWGQLFGIFLLPATFAGGEVGFTGSNGTIIPIATVLVRADGLTFVTDAEVTIAGGVAVVDVTAVTAGEDSNTDADVVFTFESPIAGAVDAVTVGADGLVEGADEEDIEDYRVRVLARMRIPPNGGSESDYVAWAKEVAGITRAWVYPQELGAGTVVVRGVRDDDGGSIIPSGGEVATAHAYLQTKRPVTAIVTFLAPVAAPLNLTISITPDNSTNRAAVQAEIEAYLNSGEPAGTTLVSQIDLAIGSAPNITDYERTVPAADVTHATGLLATLGTITWV